jgi:HNH endonuclease
MSTIGKMFGVSFSTIRERLLREGVAIRKSTDKWTRQEQIRHFWVKVNKDGPTPEPLPHWTVEQKLPPQWQWSGEVWIWVEGPCWLWTGSIVGRGYGEFNAGGQKIKAHRFSYELEFGPIEKEIFGEPVAILHACDNSICVRPAHLLKGMKSENDADMIAKGRDVKARGENQGHAKLTWENVRMIRDLWATKEWSLKQLAEKFEIGKTAIKQVVAQRTWRSK